jgi:hypothetical protein
MLGGVTRGRHTEPTLRSEPGMGSHDAPPVVELALYSRTRGMPVRRPKEMIVSTPFAIDTVDTTPPVCVLPSSSV